MILIMVNVLPASVFSAETEGVQDSVFKLTDHLTDGKEYLIVSTASGSGYALANPGGSSSGASMGSAAVAVETGDVDGDGTADAYIAAEDSAIVWTASANGSRFDLTNASDYLEGKSGDVKIFSSQQYADRGWTYTGGQLQHEGGDNTYKVYCSDGSFTSTYNSTDEKVYLFEKTETVSGTAEVTGVSLSAETLALRVGETAELTAIIAPANAANKEVTWSSDNEAVAAVSASGVVTAVSEGTAIITVTTVEGGLEADCTVTVTPKPVGQGVNIGITSDVHGNVSGLRTWLQAVQSAVDPNLDSMLYCGDYSYQMSNLDAFVNDYLQIVSATKELVGDGRGVYTSGNHEYYIGNREIALDSRFTDVDGFVRIGEALVEDNYIVYCMGAAGWYSGIGTFPDEDIQTMAEYLEAAPTDIPIFIPAHFPLHQNSGRTITGAEDMIEVLNEHPNVIFLWGHNHSQGDSHYGQILKAGDSITYASGKSMEINFTYACAGGMYQESQTEYSGLVANVSGSGDTVTFQYYRTSTGAPIGEETTIFIESADIEPVTGVTLDRSELTLVKGKSETLKATVEPSDASNRKVTWISSDPSIATVSAKGIVKAVGEGSAIITVTTVDGGFTAECEVTVEPRPAGQGVNIGITSDVHGNVTGLQSWLQAVQEDVDPALDYMLYCGDYSYEMSSLSSYLADFRSVVSTTNDLVGEGRGVYTSGNHEYYIGGHEMPLDDQFTETEGFVCLGEAISKSNYAVFCLGASSWGDNAVGSYPDSDVAALAEYLEAAPNDVPIFVMAHFPLHYYSSRTITGAGNVIDVLNEHPNVVFLWGHNHSQNDPHYGEIVTAGNSIEYASGNFKTISFTYACAGCMYQESQSPYSGLVANISDSGDTVTFRYYRTSTGAPIGEETTIRIEPGVPAATYTITASADENGSITPSGEITVKEGGSAEFTFAPVDGFELDKLLIDGEETEISGSSYAFADVTADHTIRVTFKAIVVETWEAPVYVWSEDLLSVTATRVSSLAAVETEIAAAERRVVAPATCEDAGEEKYTASFQNTAFETQTRTKELEALGHNWGEAEYVWAEDYSSVTATHVCARDESHVETETVDVTEIIASEAGCELSGKKVCIADFVNAAFKTQMKTVVIPALGHDWGEVEYVWSEDYSSVTATHVCARDEGHTETETADAVMLVTAEADCEADGETTYTAQFENPAFETQVKTVSIPALGHDWGDVEYVWAEDYSSVTATRICTRDESHADLVTVPATVTILSNPTCDTDGQKIYVAAFSGPGLSSQIMLAAIPALGHDWGEAEYVWSEDNSSVTATCACARDKSHTAIETVRTHMTVAAEASCEDEGEIIYTAEFENPVFETRTKTVTTPALGHNWGAPTYTWSSDNSKVTAKRVCTNDANHVETETVNTTAATTKATYTAEGKTVYTARFTNAAFAAQTKTVTIPKLEVPIEIQSITVNKTSVTLGDAITWTVTASGGTGTLQYRFDVCKDGQTVRQGSYGTAKIFSYTPTEVGTYSVKVYVKDGAENSKDQQSGNVAVAASTVPVLTGATAASGQITVKWSAVSGASKYAVYRKTSGSSWTLLTNTVTGTSYVDKSADLNAGTTYYYTVRAYVNGAWGGYDTTGVSAKAVAANYPSLVSATASAGQITVKWNTFSRATRYAVYRKTSGGSWTLLSNTVTGTSYVDKSADLKEGTTYYYTVRAYVGNVWGGYDNAGVSATAAASTVPVLTSATAAAGQITVKWSAVNGATKYAVYRKTSGSSWTLLTNTVTGTSYVDKSADLKEGTTYYYTVRAYVGSAWGSYDTAGVSAKAIAAAANYPVLTSATASAGQITVKWNAFTGASKYAVYRKAAGESSWTRLTNTVTGTSYVDKSADLKAGTTYYYTVRAYVGSAWGSYDSTGVSAKAVAANYPVLTSATASAGQITVKWNAFSGATKYAVYRKATGESSWTRLTNTVTGTSYTDKSSDLKAGTTYYYTVRAYVGSTWGSYDTTGVSATAK